VLKYDKKPTVAQLRADLARCSQAEVFLICGKAFAIGSHRERTSATTRGRRFVSARLTGEIEFFEWSELKQLAIRIGEVAEKVKQVAKLTRKFYK